ncbi:MAG TPA: hypothetical protein VJ732_17585 [Bryobacteraceae bacterium]|nr:hypothetical protein [Bryobacteraceae bacterium]
MKRLVVLIAPLFAFCLAQAQDLPAGKGKDLVEKICQDCHGLDVIVSQTASKDGWQSIVDSMVERGASGTKDELNTIVEYLAKSFPEQPAAGGGDKSASPDSKSTDKPADPNASSSGKSDAKVAVAPRLR